MTADTNFYSTPVARAAFKDGRELGRAEGAAAERDRIRKLIDGTVTRWSVDDGWSRPQLAAIRHIRQVLADLLQDEP